MSLRELPLSPSQWQGAYTQDDAYADSGTYTVRTFLASFISALVISLFLTVYLSSRLAWLGQVPFYVTMPVLFCITLILLQVVASFPYQFAIEFLREFYHPPASVNLQRLLNDRLYGRIRLPPPLSFFFPRFSLFRSLIVQNGVLDVERNEMAWIARYIGGPLSLVIFDGYALYLERGNRFSRVVGPADPRPFLEWHERVKYVVDLRPQSHEFPIEAWTKDGIRLLMTVRVECQVGDPKQKDSSGRWIYPYHPQAVKRAVEYYALRWDGCPEGQPREITWLDAVVGRVRAVLLPYIHSRFLGDLLVTDRQHGQVFSPEASRDILRMVNRGTHEFGVWVTDLQICHISLPQEVETALRELWRAEEQAEIIQHEGEVEALAIRERHDLVARAQRDLIINLMDELEKARHFNDLEPLMLAFSRMVENSLTDPYLRANLAKETLETLEKLRSLLQ